MARTAEPSRTSSSPSPGASVVELFAPDYVQGCYWKLADAIPGVESRYVVAPGRAPRNGRMQGVMSDISIDLAVLATVLDALPVERAPGRATAPG